MNGGVDTKVHDKSLSIEDLEHLTTQDLRVAYTAIFHIHPSKHASPDFLRGNIAWSLQALEQGKSPPTLRQALTERLHSGSPRTRSSGPAGTRLIREWQGKTYQVTVLEQGYLWQNRRYNSLSRIAREITGTRWSGPRFFGLKCMNHG